MSRLTVHGRGVLVAISLSAIGDVREVTAQAEHCDILKLAAIAGRWAVDIWLKSGASQLLQKINLLCEECISVRYKRVALVEEAELLLSTYDVHYSEYPSPP
jgi:hypothetical protein